MARVIINEQENAVTRLSNEEKAKKRKPKINRPGNQKAERGTM